MKLNFRYLLRVFFVAVGMALIPAALPAQSANGRKVGAVVPSPEVPGAQTSGAAGGNPGAVTASRATAGVRSGADAGSTTDASRQRNGAGDARNGAAERRDGGSGWGLWGLVGLFGLFGLGGRGNRAVVTETEVRRDDNPPYRRAS